MGSRSLHTASDMYLEHSQGVKREIERNPKILDAARKAFRGEAESFAFGGTVNLYRVGRLKSGMYVALRAFRIDVDEGMQSAETQAKNMEIYCQNAEDIQSLGENVPVFCVGVMHGEKAGILTEDLTANGQKGFEHRPADAYGFVVDGESRRKVFVDLDAVAIDGEFHLPRETRYP